MKEKVLFLVLGIAIGWAAHFARSEDPRTDSTAEDSSGKIQLSERRSSNRSESERQRSRNSHHSSKKSDLTDKISEIINGRSGASLEFELVALIAGLQAEDFPEALHVIFDAYHNNEILQESKLPFRRLAFAHWYSLDREQAPLYLASNETYANIAEFLTVHALIHSYHHSPDENFDRLLKNDDFTNHLSSPSELLFQVARWNTDPRHALDKILELHPNILTEAQDPFAKYGDNFESFIKGLTAAGKEHLLPQIYEQFPEAHENLISLEWENLPKDNHERVMAFADQNPDHLSHAFRQIARDHPEEATAWFLKRSAEQGPLDEAIQIVVGPDGPFSTAIDSDDPFIPSSIDYQAATEWLNQQSEKGHPTGRAWTSLLHYEHWRNDFDQFTELYQQAPEAAQQEFRNELLEQKIRYSDVKVYGEINLMNPNLSNSDTQKFQHFGLYDEFQAKARETNSAALEQIREQFLPDE